MRQSRGHRGPRTDEQRLVRDLLSSGRELTWLEFKENRAEPAQIGNYLSALSNAARLAGERRGYLVWGVADGSLDLVGTSFVWEHAKKGAEELFPWLARGLTPEVHFEFFNVELDSVSLVVLAVDAAVGSPVSFDGLRSIRVGTVVKPLQRFPDHERRLFRALENSPYEDEAADEGLSDAKVLSALDVETFAKRLNLPIPVSETARLDLLEQEELIHQVRGAWSVSKVGVLLLANDLSLFPSVQRKAMRLIVYAGNDRGKTRFEQSGNLGYLRSYEGLLAIIEENTPHNEVMERTFRTDGVPVYPLDAVRELVVNALIHQDLSVKGSSPVVEIFTSRIEISNPGESLVGISRLMDAQPRSRNERLAGLMRRLGLCEERGSGIDKVVAMCEAYQLPAPLFEDAAGSMRATMFTPITFENMSRKERIRSCYWHACLKYVSKERMTNATLRARFGVGEEKKSSISKCLRDAVESGEIRVFDPGAAPKNRSYVPSWAG